MRRTVVGGAKDEWEEPISDPEDAGVNEVRLPQTRLSDVEFVQSTRDAFTRRLEVLEDKVKYYEEPMEESNVLLVLRLSLDLINFVMGVTVLAGVADDARFQELNPIPSVGISAVAGAWALVAYVAFAAHASFWGFDAKTFGASRWCSWRSTPRRSRAQTWAPRLRSPPSVYSWPRGSSRSGSSARAALAAVAAVRKSAPRRAGPTSACA